MEQAGRKSVPLYEIDRRLEDVIEQGFSVDYDTGEVLATFEDLDQLEVAYTDKLEACGCWLKNQQALADSMKREEQNLRNRRKVVENACDRMRQYILEHIDGRFESPKVSLRPRKSERVVVDSPEEVPEEFETVTTTYSVDKTKVRKAIKEGRDVPGCHMEQHTNLTVK